MLSRAVLAASSPEIPEKKLPKPGVAPTASQYRRSLARACSGPPPTNPSTRMAPLMAPALVPITPMMSIVASSSRRSSTPHVKAPCDPPPCKAKAILRRCAMYCSVMLSTAADMSWPHLAERERIHRAAWKLSTDFLHDDKTHKHARLLT